MTKQEFYAKYYIYAVRAAGALKETPEEILARWDWETGTGTNRGARELNNLAGVNFTERARKLGAVKDANTAYAKYPSLDVFVEDFIAVMKLPMYAGILAANVTPDYRDDIVEHNKSPYSKDDYDVETVLRSINTYLGYSGQQMPTVSVSKSDMQSVMINGALVVIATGLTAAALKKIMG